MKPSYLKHLLFFFFCTSISTPSVVFAITRFELILNASRILNLSTSTGTTSTPSASPTPSTSTGTPIVYGGLAGDFTYCDTSSGLTCNTCNPGNGLNGDAGLIPCNPNQIYDDLSLDISFRSDVDGPPLISDKDGNRINFEIIEGSASSNPKGSLVRLAVRWGEICNKIGSADCSALVGTTLISSSIRVGIDGNGDDNFISTGTGGTGTGTDEYGTIQVRLLGAISQFHLGYDDCPSDGGVCYFEVNPGDEKVSLPELKAGASFPTSTNGKYYAIRVLFSPDSFDAINSSSQHVDLVVTGSGEKDFTTSPERVEGLQNEIKYYFKIATMDEAGNVGLYSDQAHDSACQDPPGTDVCHIAKPGEVLGVLDKELNCFIATAAYGSRMAPQVNVFREFRNRFLHRFNFGKQLTRWYYKHSPKYASIIAKHENLRIASQMILWPVLGGVWFANLLGPSGCILFFGMLLTLLIFYRPLRFHIRQMKAIKVQSQKIRSNDDLHR